MAKEYKSLFLTTYLMKSFNKFGLITLLFGSKPSFLLIHCTFQVIIEKHKGLLATSRYLICY